jgi:hypothetical protein
VAHACNDDLCLRHGPLPLPARRLRRRKLAKSPDAAKPRRALTSLRSAPSSAPSAERYIGRSTEGNRRRIHAYGKATLDRDAIQEVFGGPA